MIQTHCICCVLHFQSYAATDLTGGTGLRPGGWGPLALLPKIPLTPELSYLPILYILCVEDKWSKKQCFGHVRMF